MEAIILSKQQKSAIQIQPRQEFNTISHPPPEEEEINADAILEYSE